MTGNLTEGDLVVISPPMYIRHPIVLVITPIADLFKPPTLGGSAGHSLEHLVWKEDTDIWVSLPFPSS